MDFAGPTPHRRKGRTDGATAALDISSGATDPPRNGARINLLDAKCNYLLHLSQLKGLQLSCHFLIAQPMTFRRPIGILWLAFTAS